MKSGNDLYHAFPGIKAAIDGSINRRPNPGTSDPMI